MIGLLSLATALPEFRFGTAQLIDALGVRLSDELQETISRLGVEQRFSVVENYPSMLVGEPARQTGSATELCAQAARSCIERWGGDPSEIGLMIAATNTPAQLLPSLVAEVSARLHGTLSRSISTVNMQAQGCAVLLKAVEVAGWYLAANPRRKAIIMLGEAHTPFIPSLTAKQYFGFHELARRSRGGADDAAIARQKSETTFAIQAMLFGDGAVALLVGAEEGFASFGPVAHLTNDAPADVDLLAMEGGSLRPDFRGKPRYLMGPDVPQRGAHYAMATVREALAHPDSPVRSLQEVNDCLIHTGSKKILDGVCKQLEIPTDSPRVAISYEILRRYANLSCASTGFMLAAKTYPRGPAALVSFGVGFAASAGILNFN